MRISDATIKELLKKADKLTIEQLDTLEDEEKKSNRPLQDIVISEDLLSDKELTKLYSEYAEIPYVELNPKDIPKEILTQIPERIARQYNAVLFAVVDGVKQLAMEDPDDIQAIDFIQKNTGSKFQIFIATKENILQTLENYGESVASELDKVIEVQKEDEASTEQISEEDVAEDSPIAQTVNLIIEYAIRAEASDIHIEPREDFVQIRYRVDGVLKEANRLPKNVVNALISRIKILSNLKIDERRVPQDGRFKVTVAGKQYAFRVSTLPVTDGEKVAMRILDEGSKALSLEQLGCWGASLTLINQAMTEPNGMILITGPTGSGKSTSLFSILSLLNSPTVNISTVEDPVEYKINGTNQTQVNPKAGMTFVTGLRALLRQDPNIIMVGEIRDGETANLGIQAALTGHLVFSTLHTNNAATCLPRLLDMGIEPFLIASTVRVVVGQRLVRKLCTICRETYEPSKEQLVELYKVFGIKDETDLARIHNLEKQAADQHIGDAIGANLSSTDTIITRLYKAHDGGCDECGKSGYRSRMGIYEVLDNSITLQKLIVANATSNDIQEQGIKEGMVTMQTDGFVKALRGETSIEEIIRVTKD